MSVQVGPHTWEPNRWWDRLRGREGACWWCQLPRRYHPVPLNVAGRPDRRARGRGARPFRGAGRG